MWKYNGLLQVPYERYGTVVKLPAPALRWGYGPGRGG